MSLDFESALAVCEKHASRLGSAMNKLQRLFPIAPETLVSLDDETLSKGQSLIFAVASNRRYVKPTGL
jgi:hypothetical protein